MEKGREPNEDSFRDEEVEAENPVMPETPTATTREDDKGGQKASGVGASIISSIVRKNAPPRQYIRDRCDGTSKSGESRPPLRPCLPPPCVKWCPSVFEQNPCCEFAGGCGLIKPDDAKWRRILCRVGLASNLVGFALTIVACFSISLHFDTLMRTAFSFGWSVSNNPIFPGIEVGIGLRGVALRRAFGTPREVVWTFDDFCDRSFRTGTVNYFGDGVCQGCAETSSGLVGTLIMSLITYLPNFFTDITRMYVNYDVNCQKVSGSFVTLASMIMSLYTWQGYVQSCFGVFYEGVIPYSTEGAAVPWEEFLAMTDDEKKLLILVSMDYNWKAGPGLICIVTATILKVVDIICNMMVPTPTITRNREEQQEYEVLGAEGET